MKRFLFSITIFLALVILQVSFIHSLPYPFDRIPLLLVISVYLYQYSNRVEALWWIVGYGFILDALSLSFIRFEFLSYFFMMIGLWLLAGYVFTNRSFYGMAATSVLCLFFLTVSQLLIASTEALFSSAVVVWKDILLTFLWATSFSVFILLFVCPQIVRASRIMIHTLFGRI